MKARLALVLALTAFVSAQTQTPEVRGIIMDRGAAMPLGGAIVTLYEFAPNEESVIVRKSVATTITAPDGSFSFKPGHLARFMVGVKKDGYSVGSANDEPLSIAELDQANPAQTIRMSLIRPGAITGRVIDRDGNPVANLRVGIDTGMEASMRLPGAITALTNAEGIFIAEKLLPNPYIVRISPSARDEDGAREGEELAAFTEDAFKIVEEDVELSYWPGGFSSPQQVLPISVAGGALANAGTITIRKVPYYRVRVTYNGECASNERWIYRVGIPVQGFLSAASEHYTSCRKDGLLTRLAPGSYDLAIWSGRDVDRWALASFTITDKNIEIPLVFNEPATITGRVTTPSGGPDLKTLGPVQISVAAVNLPSGKGFALATDGRFTLEQIPWKSHWISVHVQNPKTYVKEIRYNGVPLRSRELEATAGSTLEVVVDDGAATLSIRMKNGESPAGGLAILAPVSLVALPSIRMQSEPFFFIMGENRGNVPITFGNLPPGDYRLLTAPTSLSDEFLDGDGSDLAARFQQAPRITLGRGEQKSIEVQLK